MKLAVMQPCYLPWRGYFALMKHADLFVHLDDVPLPQGRSLQTRVAIKTAQGRRWLTVPVHHQAGQLICDVTIAEGLWRTKHLRTLQQELPRSAHIVEDLYSREWNRLVDLNVQIISRLADTLHIHVETIWSSALQFSEHGWRKILAICRALGATQYITGHGARNYFDHEAFEQAGVDVLYLDYDLSRYPQPHGAFDPFVSVLDVIAHAPDPLQFVDAALVPWRTFLARPQHALAMHAAATEHEDYSQ